MGVIQHSTYPFANESSMGTAKPGRVPVGVIIAMQAVSKLPIFPPSPEEDEELLATTSPSGQARHGSDDTGSPINAISNNHSTESTRFPPTSEETPPWPSSSGSGLHPRKARFEGQGSAEGSSGQSSSVPYNMRARYGSLMTAHSNVDMSEPPPEYFPRQGPSSAGGSDIAG